MIDRPTHFPLGASMNLSDIEVVMRYFLIIGLALLTGCGGDSNDVSSIDFAPTQPKLLTTGAPTGDVRVYARGILNVGLSLYRHLDDEHVNFVYSPLGVHTSVGVLTHGIERPLRDEIRVALHTDLHGIRFESAASTLLHGVFEDAKTVETLHVGPSLWLQDGRSFAPEFLRRVVDFYGQQLYTADFRDGSERVVDEMNEWMSQQTSGQIENFVDEKMIDDQASLVSTCAVVLKSPWHYAFDPSATKEMPFHVGDGKSVNVHMMNLTAKLSYIETKIWKMAYLPYRGGQFGMFLFVPKREGGLASAMKATDDKEIGFMSSSMAVRRVAVSLPRLSFNSTFSVGDALSDMGLGEVFGTSGKTLSKLTDGSESPVALSVIPAAAKLELMETGSKVADAKSKQSVGEKEKAVEMRCDQPFMFMVQHRKTGAILLMGRVSDPSQ